ncbi:AAEL007679-PA [Aedes aegypti]|uniref:E3 ubiquitin-protein ligase PPP1R11 n=2 Tax=Aedes aegypti TaxID=7159 RepID=A0A1S4FH64_AEDAE|nr:protein phosphatase 1 regulatory subunit 11 [Aedes aegypti]EAT40594.1 AAEL007679-PA [Aedes aegypti]
MAADDSAAIMRSEGGLVTSAGGSRTITETITQEQIPSTSQEPPVLRLRLKKPRTDKKVQWTNGTVDNEHMNKKKSKCCCIYVKPREFGESSSESEGECEHCFGHVEQKKKRKPIPDSDSVDSGGGPSKDPSSNNNGPGDSEPNVL